MTGMDAAPLALLALLLLALLLVAGLNHLTRDDVTR